MTHSRIVGRIAAAALIALASCSLYLGDAGAEPTSGDACVRDFFTVGRVDHGLTPAAIVELINTDGDPTFQVDNVGHLRERVANAEIGIFDTSGVFHICPNPT